MFPSAGCAAVPQDPFGRRPAVSPDGLRRARLLLRLSVPLNKCDSVLRHCVTSSVGVCPFMSREAAGFGFESWAREREWLHPPVADCCVPGCGAVWGEKVTGHRWSLRNTDI